MQVELNRSGSAAFQRRVKLPIEAATGSSQRHSHSLLNIEVLYVERVVFDELAARLNVFAHQTSVKMASVSVRSSSFTSSNVRRSGSIVVSHNCCELISPSPL